MSRFTVVLNEVLDRMKSHAGVTRQQFAGRIEMPMSTLASYANGRPPDPDALGRIASGFEQHDAIHLIQAHLFDETPEDWRDRVNGAPQVPRSIRLADADILPLRFRRDLQLIAAEGLHNDELIQFIRDTVQLLKLSDSEEKVWPPPKIENFRPQEIPAGPAHGRKPSTRSMPPSIAAEAPPEALPHKVIPKTKSTAAGVEKTIRESPKK